jgi:hypothetical protein
MLISARSLVARWLTKAEENFSSDAGESPALSRPSIDQRPERPRESGRSSWRFHELQAEWRPLPCRPWAKLPTQERPSYKAGLVLRKIRRMGREPLNPTGPMTATERSARRYVPKCKSFN